MGFSLHDSYKRKYENHGCKCYCNSQVFGGSDLLLVHALEKVLVPWFIIRFTAASRMCSHKGEFSVSGSRAVLELCSPVSRGLGSRMRT